ncbi:MAG: ABC transporter permease [Acidobacteriota bacterium]
MKGPLFRRLVSSLILLWLIVSFTFVLLQIAPGDPLATLTQGTSGKLPPEQIARLERIYGLDRPVHEQYFSWLSSALTGDWGYSITQQRPVTRIIAEALPTTLSLALAAILVEYLIAIPLGVWAARRAGTWKDHALRGASLLLWAMPAFWAGLMALLVFSYWLPWFPGGHSSSPMAHQLPWFRQLWDRLHHLTLPALVLGVLAAGGTARFVRNGLLEILGQDFIRTARAKGLPERRVVWVHGMRNAMVPVLQILGLSLPILLNGSLVIEIVFSLPGLGRATVQAIAARDYPVLLATTAFSGVLVIGANLLVDLVHTALDPRVRRA